MSSSVASISRTVSNSGRNMSSGAKRAASSGSAVSAATDSSPAERSSRTTSASSVAVSRTRAWFAGSCAGTLSRAGVVRYGPCTMKPRNVSFSVGKNTLSGARSSRSTRPASARIAISTRSGRSPRGACASPDGCAPRPSTRRCHTSHSCARDRPLVTVTRRLDSLRGSVRRSMTETATPAPPTRSRVMLARNSRTPGSSAASAAEISRTATAAGTSS